MELLEKQNRWLFKNLTKDLIGYMDNNLTEDESNIADEYWETIRSADLQKLSWFYSFGESVRHRVENINQYRYGLSFGFNKIVINSDGWIERSHFPHKENIFFEVNLKKEIEDNYVMLGQSPNSKWVNGHWLNCGGYGSVNGLTVFNKPFETREEALIDAVNEIRNRIENGINQKDQQNYPLPYCSQLLKKLLTLIPENEPAIKKELKQLELFT